MKNIYKIVTLAAILLVVNSVYAFAIPIAIGTYKKPSHSHTPSYVFDSVSFQQFTSHQVKNGETIASIAKKFKVTEKEIYKFNPDAKIRIYKGLVLIIPAQPQGGGVTGGTEGKPEDVIEEKPSIQETEAYDFLTHKVKRRETLPGLAKKYGVSEALIKKYNTSLYSNPLRKGDKIQIPVPEKEIVAFQEEIIPITPKTDKEFKTDPVATTKQIAKEATPVVVVPKEPIYETITVTENVPYTAKKQETKYGISKAYGITVAELEALNPEIVDGLNEGAVILVPVTTTKQVVVAQAATTYDRVYEVAQGDTMYSLPRKLAVTVDELITLNPDLAGGLKTGMILTLPAITTSETTATTSGNTYTFPNTVSKINLVDSISDRSIKRVAVMLPFGLSRLNTATDVSREELIKSNGVMRIALDFHSGVVLAQEMAKMDGISSIVDVYDTDRIKSDGDAVNARKVEDIILSNDFKNVDAVVGPLLGANVNRAASLLALNNVPVISPITSNVELRSNVFQSRPSGEVQRDKMIEYLKEYGQGKRIMIIADKKNGANVRRVRNLFTKVIEITPRESEDGYYLNPDDISRHLNVPDENGLAQETSEVQESWWVIIESNDIPLISTVITDLNALASYNDLTLFTTNKGSAFESDEIQNGQLSNLNFHFPSMDKPYDEDEHQAFKNMYQDRYGVTPNTYALRGFDIMYDTLLRLAYKGDLYEAASSDIETDQLENKFMYVKKPFGGYQNTGVYLIKYGEGLTLKEVVPPVMITLEATEDGKE